MKIVALRYLNWSTSAGGKHFTGNIYRDDGPPIELTRTLSHREAKELSESEDRLWLKNEVKTNKFTSLEQLKRYAILWCEKNLGSEWLLQNFDYSDLYRPIAGSGKILKFMDTLEGLAEWWESVPDNERTIAKIAHAYQTWQNIIKNADEN
jgi:hypothetical protein